jgi:hypothetical protein
MNEEVCVDDIAKLLEVSRKSAIQRMARLSQTASGRQTKHAKCWQPRSLPAAGVKRKPAAYPEVCRTENEPGDRLEEVLQ